MRGATPTRRGVMMGAAAGLLGARRAAAAEPALEFNSPYNFVFIEKEGSVVTFRYSRNRGRMSAIDLDNPPFQVVPYTRYYFAADLLKPNPRRVLMAGLGAGGFHRLFNVTHPDARLVTVEIDPMILRLAQEQAGLRTGPSNEVVIDDARIFLRRSRETYDWILLDAFDRNAQIPVHLTTREFFRIIADRLPDDGLMLTNLHQGTTFFTSHVATIRDVFPEVVLLPVNGVANVIVVAAKTPKGSIDRRLRSYGPEERERYRSYGVYLDEIVKNIVQERDYLDYLGDRAMVLTDDYAPVESLDRETVPDIQPRRP
jgi:spermidine synthase